MTPQHRQVTDGNDFKLFGFVSKASQKGIIKTIFGTLIVIILLQEGRAQLQNYRYDEMVRTFTNAAIEKDKVTTDIYKQLLLETLKTKNSFDSALSR